MLERNERLVLHGESKFGWIAYCPVAATGVSGIEIDKLADQWEFGRTQFQKNDKFAPQQVTFKKGEEVGTFKMGSTVVMLVEVPKSFKFEESLVGQKVRYGQVVGQVG